MTEKNDYVIVRLNGFLLNAGVVGFLKALDYAAGCDPLGCVKGRDYIINGQELWISKSFLLTHDLAELYIKAMVFYLKDSTDYVRKLSARNVIQAKFEKFDPENKAMKKEINDIFRDFTKMLEKNSFKAGYEILRNKGVSNAPTEELVAAFKKETDLFAKRALYESLCDLLELPEVQEVLIFKELMYSRINLFMENFAFYLPKLLRIDPKIAYSNNFVKPLNDLITLNRRNTKRCIDCGEVVYETFSLSFMNDVADDTGRKKSYYWSCNPDAFLCPVCQFTYTFVPIGFSYIGQDAVFVNNCNDIPTLTAIMAAFESDNENPDEKLSWFKLYNLFTSNKLTQLRNRINNIQVIYRDRNLGRYNMNTIDKRTIEVLAESKKEFAVLQNRFVKNDNEFIGLYQTTVELVIRRRSLYPFLSKLTRLALKENNRTNYLFPILIIEIKSKGGQRMAENIKRAYAAKKLGETMRLTLTADVTQEKDRDNKLRGLVYQLLNAVSSGNRDNFLNMIIRTYSSSGKPVPDLFLSCFASDEDFKEIGFAYLLGLKADGRRQEENE